MKSKRPFRAIICLFSFAVLASCAGIYSDYSTDPIDPHDRPAELVRKDFTDNLLPKNEDPVDIKLKEPPMPKMSDILLTPKRPKIGVNKTVTLSVTEDVPLKDVFVELARLADIDIEVDPRISGGVIFKAKNKPFDEVVERISDLAGLRYSVNNGVLRIQRDTPYVENYTVDFPNINRSNSGSINVNTGSSGGSSGGGSGSGGSGNTNSNSNSNSGSSSGNSSGGGVTSGSSNSISSSYDGDLWTSISNDIKAIIGSGPAGAQAGADSSFVTINRQANNITVSTTQKNHLKIREYLARIEQYTSAQVLIEAKVVEVSLNDQFQTGIDWRAVTDAGNGININTAIPVADGNIPDLVTIGGSRDNGNLSSAVQLAQEFGTLRTLSSPRVLVLNNQQAVLSFAKNQVYFTIDVQTDTNGATDAAGNTNRTTTVDSTLNTIPVGLILTLQPSINEKTGDILMNIRPTVSRLTGTTVEDPAVAFAASENNVDISSTIPEVEVREMDSLLRLRSGEIMAIGGMIEQRINNNDTGVPYVSDIPLLGNAFKTTLKDHQSIQTVIFLKATIVPSYGVDKPDRKFYNTFETDPRPLAF